MRYFVLFFIVCISCGKNSKENYAEQIGSNLKDSVFRLPEGAEVIKDKDTMLLDFSKNGVADKIYIVKIKTIRTKDSTGINFFRINFYRKEKVIYSYPLKINFGNEEGDWYLIEDFMKDPKTESTDQRFISLSYGVATCGYGQSEFLFFLDQGKIELFAEWESMSDGGYGTYTDFVPKLAGQGALSITSKSINVDAGEMNQDSIETVEISYSDSVLYTFAKGKWLAKRITPKHSVYRKEIKTAEVYFKTPSE